MADLVTGIRQIADAPDPIGRVLAKTELAPGLVLQKETTSLGVLLVIFEVPTCSILMLLLKAYYHVIVSSRRSSPALCSRH